MRISDWSSDVCSSDLTRDVPQIRDTGKAPQAAIQAHHPEHQTLCQQHDQEFGGKPRPLDRTLNIAVAQIDQAGPANPRSEERRVGKERVSTGRSRWSPVHYKKKYIETMIEKKK